jgi:hypothetical protein
MLQYKLKWRPLLQQHFSLAVDICFCCKRTEPRNDKLFVLLAVILSNLFMFFGFFYEDISDYILTSHYRSVNNKDSAASHNLGLFSQIKDAN